MNNKIILLLTYYSLCQDIEACVALANTMKSLLGPKSFEKLLVHFDGTVSSTNDGATAMSSMVRFSMN